MMDYPHVRASTHCPLCQQEKDEGLLICWVCYRLHDLRSGNHEAEIMIKRAEESLRGSPMIR